jgi:ABC-type spermidine/putrescine transport system permease subunit I
MIHKFLSISRDNGLAIASLVCSIVSIAFFALPAVLGVIFGFVARSQIRQSSGAQTGAGMASAGIIVGIVIIGFWAFVFIIPALSR